MDGIFPDILDAFLLGFHVGKSTSPMYPSWDMKKHKMLHIVTRFFATDCSDPSVDALTKS